MNGIANEGAENYLHSPLRERIVEHIFVGKALQWLWVNRKDDLADVEVLRSEVDAGGYDLVMAYKEIVRYIQFKTTLAKGKRANITTSAKLIAKPGGCIIWIFITPDLEIVNYRWLDQFPDVQSMKNAKHTKGNAKGKKAERPGQWIISKGKFSKPRSLDEIMEHCHDLGHILSRRYKILICVTPLPPHPSTPPAKPVSSAAASSPQRCAPRATSGLCVGCPI